LPAPKALAASRVAGIQIQPDRELAMMVTPIPLAARFTAASGDQLAKQAPRSDWASIESTIWQRLEAVPYLFYRASPRFGGRAHTIKIRPTAGLPVAAAKAACYEKISPAAFCRGIRGQGGNAGREVREIRQFGLAAPIMALAPSPAER
jgi:hypothetical protein